MSFQVLLAAALFLVGSDPAQTGNDAITDLTVRIVVQRDGSLSVHESLTCEGRKAALSTIIRAHHAEREDLVMADGPTSGGRFTLIATYSADGNVLWGRHEHTVRYTIASGWKLPIARAKATIELPGSVAAHAIKHRGWADRESAQRVPIASLVDPETREVRFRSDGLSAGQRLSAEVTVPRGILHSKIPTYEAITDFHTHLTVLEDGGLKVVETIKVNVLGNEIRRGLLREIPNTRYGPHWTIIEKPLSIRSVRRDGFAEPWSEETTATGIQLRIGDADVMLEHRVHTYEITYETSGWLGFFEEHDELYWNTTGHFWAFPILSASATVALPEGADVADAGTDSWIGRFETQGRSAVVTRDAKTRTVAFKSTGFALAPGCGMTIAVKWPKGLVHAPTQAEESAAFWAANPYFLVGGIGTAVVLAWYLFAWVLVGRDRRDHAIVPRFRPPEGLSAAAMRYVVRRKFDGRCFSAAIVSLAVKGVIKITRSEDAWQLATANGERLRTKGSNWKSLSSGERTVARELFEGGVRLVRIGRTASDSVGGAVRKLHKHVRKERSKKNFALNRAWLVPGLVMSAILVMACSGATRTTPGVLGWAVGFVLAAVGLSGCIAAARSAWLDLRGTARGSRARWGIRGKLLLLALGAAACGAVFAAHPLIMTRAAELAIAPATVAAFWMIPLVLALAAMSLVFVKLLEAPTLEGGRILDEIEGFAMYLRTAEARQLARIQAPEETVELYSRYLPYAIALDLENHWAERFKVVLEEAGPELGWLHHHDRSWRSWRTSFGDLGGGIADSVRAEVKIARGSGGSGRYASSGSSGFSSSSSYSGGGFSGGGGGGGGGGGW